MNAIRAHMLQPTTTSITYFTASIDILSNNLSQYMHMYSFDEATVTAIYKKIRN